MSVRVSAVPHVVGRADELETIERFLAGDWPSALLLTGPAGIGKSVLWAAGATSAEALGVTVLVARFAEAELEVAYSGLELLVGQQVEQHGDRLPAHRRSVLDAVLLHTDGATVADLRSVGLAVAELLAVIATGSPVLLALDDLMWLDATSATALGYALRRLGDRSIGVLATARPGASPAASQVLGAIDETRRRSVTVTGLALGGVGRLLQERLDLRVPRAQLVRLHDLSGGNPLTALEMGRALLGGQQLSSGFEQAELMWRRLAALAPDVRELLALVGAAGTLTLEVAERVLDDADRTVADAVAAGVLTAEGGRLACDHPLMGSIGYELASPTTRRHLHRRLAEELSGPEQRAVHLALATVGPDHDVAARLENAARSIARQGSPARAGELAAMAVERTPASDPAGGRRRMLLHARMLLAAGETTEAAALLDELVDATPPGPERVDPLLCRCDLAAGSDRRGSARSDAEMALEHAQGDPILVARCHAAIAQSTDLGVIDELEHASAVIALVAPHDDPDSVAQALTTIVQARLAAGDGIDVELFDQAMALDPLVEMRTIDRPLSSLVTVPRTAGDLERAREMQHAAIDGARRRGDEAAVPFQLTQLAAIELRHGDVAAADRSLDEAEELAAWCQLELPTVAYRALSAALAGRLDEAEALAGPARAATVAKGHHWALPLLDRPLGLAALQRGDAARAVDLLEEVRRSALAGGIVEPAWFATDADLVEALVASGHTERAREVTADLERVADRGRLAWTRLAAARSRLVLVDDRALDAAIAHAEARLTEVTSPYEQARTWLVIGRVLARRGRRGAARAALTQAEGLFTGLGLGGFADLTRREAGRLGGRARRTTELTDSERQVAELAGQGLTNREIGARLFLSVRTVESHLSAAYRKLGVRSRTELARTLGPGPATPT